MGEARSVNPLVEQFRKGGVPRDLRLMAAQGLLPLKPADVVELLHHLLADADEAIRTAAGTSLADLPATELLPVLKDRLTPPGVLGWAVAGRSEKELREAALQNPATSDEAVEAAVGSLPEDLAELVVINQVRLLRRTSLLVALEGNEALNADQRRRLRELRESFHIGEEPEAPPAAAPAAGAPPAEAQGAGGPGSGAPGAEAPEEEGAGEGDEALTVEDAMVRYLTDEERQHEEKVSALQRLYRLNTAEKVVTALKGSREERAILVRDPNRIVGTAVLGSPRLTEAEIESFAGMKNIPADILRHIGNHKEWTKRYNVISSLVRNPRTPLAISIGMVSRLNPRDLKSVAVDRNVPEVIRKQAQKFVRTSPGGGPQKH